MAMLAALVLSSLVASAEERDVTPAEPEEVIVYGDAFSRWDGTRWFVDTQVGFPLPYTLIAVENVLMEAIAVQLKLSIACEKTWRRGKKHYEVDCEIEDVGLQAASWRNERYADRVLGELDDALTKKKIQLVVNWDGRLDDIDLDGLAEGTIREVALREQARQLLVRAMAGFHMKLPPDNQIRRGQWVEYGSTLFQIPSTEARGGSMEAGMDSRPPRVLNSIGGAYILHQVDPFRGHTVVQSVGQGTVLVGDEDKGTSSYFKLSLDSVGIFDKASGFMTERVWTLSGFSTASSVLSDGRLDAVYFHNGRLKQLGAEERPDVGPTRLVARPGVTDPDLPAWEALQ